MSRKLVLAMSLTIVLMGMLGVAFKVQKVGASGTVYIRADGSVDPPSAPISNVGNVTYTFMWDIYDEIVIQRNNIIIDGNGYTLQGTGALDSKGISLSGRSNITIKNVRINAFSYGINLTGSSGNSIFANHITNCSAGLWLYGSSSYNKIYGNNMTANKGYGVYLLYSSNYNSIFENNMTANNWPCISLVESSNNNISRNNIIANNQDGIALFASSNNTISGNNITNNDSGIELYNSSNNNTISGNNITANDIDGIYLDESSSNNIYGNNIIANIDYGIELYGSSNNNIISGNNITNSDYGLWVEGSLNTISGNNITNNRAFVGSEGIYIGYSVKNNVVFGNNIANNYYGIELYDYSNNNTIYGNNIANNEWYGLFQHTSSDNSIYHNNFVNNTNHVLTFDSVNVWDNGVEGNYWSNYTGVDSDHDGIGDTSHIIDADNQDNYPLMGMFHSFSTPLGYNVNVISNSTIEGFQYFESNSTIKMYVSNMTANQTFGFCRVSIPKSLMSPPYTVIIDDGSTEVLYFNGTVYDNSTHRWIYFAYQHSTRKVEIIPEFPTWTSMLLILIVLTAAIAICKRRLLKTPIH